MVVVPVNIAESEEREASERIYRELKDKDIDVLFDDRPERLGAKLKDIDLIGIPYKVIIGSRSLKESMIEVKHRQDGKMERVGINTCAAYLESILKSHKA